MLTLCYIIIHTNNITHIDCAYKTLYHKITPLFLNTFGDILKIEGGEAYWTKK